MSEARLHRGHRPGREGGGLTRHSGEHFFGILVDHVSICFNVSEENAREDWQDWTKSMVWVGPPGWFRMDQRKGSSGKISKRFCPSLTCELIISLSAG